MKKDRRTPDARKFHALIAVVFALGGGSSLARADQPSNSNQTGEQTATEAITPGSVPTGISPVPSPTQGAAGVSVQTVTPPPPPRPAVESPDVGAVNTSWFARRPLTLAAGEDAGRWAVTFYGFLEADLIFDTTRSYNDVIGSALVARSDTYDGRTGRTQSSIR